MNSKSRLVKIVLALGVSTAMISGCGINPLNIGSSKNNFYPNTSASIITISGAKEFRLDDIVIDSDGGFLLLGNSEDVEMTWFGGFPIDRLSKRTAGTKDYFISKINPKGEVEWTKVFGGINLDGLVKEATMEASDGNLFITGTMGSEGIDFGITRLDTENYSSSYIAKFDIESGEFIWAKSLEPLYLETAEDLIEKLKDNDVLVRVEMALGNVEFKSFEDVDISNFIYEKELAQNLTGISPIASTNDGSLIIALSRSIGDRQIHCKYLTAAYAIDPYTNEPFPKDNCDATITNVFKINPDGEIGFKKTIEGFSIKDRSFEMGDRIVSSSDGNIILLGNNNIFPRPILEGYDSNSESLFRILGTQAEKEEGIDVYFKNTKKIIKLNNTGELLWEKEYSVRPHIPIKYEIGEEDWEFSHRLKQSEGLTINDLVGGGEDFKYTLSATNDGGAIIAGDFKLESYFDDSNSLIAGSNYADYYVAKINSDGEWVWTQRTGNALNFTGGNDSKADSLTVGATNDGGAIISGVFGRDGISFGVDINIQDIGVQDAFGLRDPVGNIFLAKINSDGEWVWGQGIFGGLNHDSVEYTRLITTSDNGAIIAGGSNFEKEMILGGETFSYQLFIAKIKSDGEWNLKKN